MDSQELVAELKQELEDGILTPYDTIQILSFRTATKLVVIDWYYDDKKMQELVTPDALTEPDELIEMAQILKSYERDRSRLKSIRVGLLLSLMEDYSEAVV